MTPKRFWIFIIILNIILNMKLLYVQFDTNFSLKQT